MDKNVMLQVSDSIRIVEKLKEVRRIAEELFQESIDGIKNGQAHLRYAITEKRIMAIMDLIINSENGDDTLNEQGLYNEILEVLM